MGRRAVSEGAGKQQTPRKQRSPPAGVVDLTQEAIGPPAKRLCRKEPEQDHNSSLAPARCSNWDRSCEQREPITITIRNNINEYGGEGVCLKEMLANADDARATQFTICLDKSHYGTQGLLKDSMQDMQLAALLVGNNAVFSEQDFIGYTKKIGDSSKTGDSRTVGNFGKGAMTAYSVSDTIQLISGDEILLLDPHARHLPDDAPSLRANMANRDSLWYVDIMAEAPGQLEAFLSVTAACTALPTFQAGTHYPGTLFRLALRTREAAQASIISSEAIDADQFLNSTLNDFMSTAPDLLLFTRSVKTISVYVKESAESDAVLLHECKASSEVMAGEGQVLTQMLTVGIQHGGTKPDSSKVWVLATDKALDAEGTNGVAAALHLSQGPLTGDNFSLPSIAGCMYATMPLPFGVTALPVHMNGAFWVQSDRRKLWSGEGSRGKEAQNDKVLVESVAPAWAEVIATVCNICHRVSVTAPTDLYSLWPPRTSTLHPKELRPVRSATFSCLLKNNSRILWSPTADLAEGGKDGQWVTVTEACFMSASDRPNQLVINVARRVGLHIVQVPISIQQALHEAATAEGKPLTMLSPAVLRKALRRAGNMVKAEEVGDVLLYAIKDNQYMDLHGLYLILLLDGSVQQFRCGPAPSGNDQAKEKLYLMWRHQRSKELYDLMPDSKHEQVETCAAWKQLSKLTVEGGGLLMEAGLMNIQVPSVPALASRLPASWKGNTCQYAACGSGTAPRQEWLEGFWAVAVNQMWEQFPAVFGDFLLVPVAGEQLASARYCQAKAALTTVHLNPRPSSGREGSPAAAGNNDKAAELLSKVGCLCISDSRADMVCTIAPDREPITLAFSAAADGLGLPLQTLISVGHLGTDTFAGVCEILAKLDSKKCQQRVQGVLRQCTIFEDINDAQLDLARRTDVRLLPTQAWEQSVTPLHELLPWTFIKYHSATPTQKRILRNAGFQCMDVATFLNDDLLPEIYSSVSTDLEPLLLKALDSLANLPTAQLKQPLKVFVNAKLHRVISLADSSSKLMRFLFGKTSGYARYSLLPENYAEGSRLATLQRYGLAHDNLPDHRCFMACTDQFVRMYEGKDRTAGMSKHSGMLLEMLQCNVESYKARIPQAEWEEACHLMSTKPFLLKAAVVSPYDSNPGPLLVSLQDSEDYTHYRMVANAVAVTEPSLGDTVQLRAMLGLPAGPQPQHVVTHLLHTAEARRQQMQSGHNIGPLNKHIEEDVQKAYEYLVRLVSQQLASKQHRELAKLTKQLREAAWVMVQTSQRFVAPCDLVFEIDEDQEGAIQVPQVLLQLIKSEPAVRQWMVDKLQITDLHHRAPAVRQLHRSRVTTAVTAREYLADSFNNVAAYPDAVVSVDGKEIQLHKLVVAKGCEVLAKRWGPLWDRSKDTLVLDSMLQCEECSVQVSYTTALMFFGFFYTWQVTWPDGEADMQSALELLFMASVYDVPYMVCEAEMALRRGVNVENCCKLLELADHHAAQQLRRFCLHFIANGHKLVSKAEGFKSLSPELLDEVDKARVILQHSAT